MAAAREELERWAALVGERVGLHQWLRRRLGSSGRVRRTATVQRVRLAWVRLHPVAQNPAVTPNRRFRRGCQSFCVRVMSVRKGCVRLSWSVYNLNPHRASFSWARGELARSGVAKDLQAIPKPTTTVTKIATPTKSTDAVTNGRPTVSGSRLTLHAATVP